MSPTWPVRIVPPDVAAGVGGMGTAVATGCVTVGFAAGTNVAVDVGADGAGAPQPARKPACFPRQAARAPCAC